MKLAYYAPEIRFNIELDQGDFFHGKLSDEKISRDLALQDLDIGVVRLFEPFVVAHFENVKEIVQSCIDDWELGRYPCKIESKQKRKSRSKELQFERLLKN